MAKLGASFAQKLREAVRQSDIKMRRFRKLRKQFIESACGPYYGGFDNGKLIDTQKVNLLYSLSSILVPLIVQPVKPMVRTDRDWLWYPGQKLATAIEKIWKDAQANVMMEQVAFDSMFARGIAWVGMGPSPSGKYPEPTGFFEDPGMPTVRAVEEDDFVNDTDARSSDEINFRGHRYRVPFDYAWDLKLYNREVLDNNRNQLDHEREQNKFGADNSPFSEPLIDFIELSDIWLPRHGVVVTLANTGDLLREEAYKGPETGQYSILTYQDVPGNSLPIPPAAATYNLGGIINEIMTAIENQARSTKTVYVTRPGGVKTAEAMIAASDRQVIEGDPDNVKAFTTGGVNAEHFQTVAQLYQWYNRIAGNPEMLGGLAEQASTATVNQMLFGGASNTLGFKKGRARRFAIDLMKKIGFYLWYGETKLNLKVATELGHTEDSWADQREGDLLDYSFDVQPYVDVADSPLEEYKRTMDALRSYLLPLASLGAQQGDLLDVAALNEAMAIKLNLPELRNIYRKGQPIQNASVSGVASEMRPASPGPSSVVINQGAQAQQGSMPQTRAATPGRKASPSAMAPMPQTQVA